MLKIIWYSDTHLNRLLPWNRFLFVKRVKSQKADGLFLTGDISHGLSINSDLQYLAEKLDIPIYFVLGNHDYYLRSMDKVHDQLLNLTSKYSNLHWLTNSQVLSLNKKTAVIGAEGWYDASLGDPEYLKYTLDWLLIKDFRKLSNFKERLAKFKELALNSADLISKKLEESFENHKITYILTHYPAWEQATRDVGTYMEKFWLPYNVNLTMGRAIEKVVKKHKKKRVIVLSGHLHCQSTIMVNKRIQCVVNDASYMNIFHAPQNKNILYI